MADIGLFPGASEYVVRQMTWEAEDVLSLVLAREGEHVPEWTFGAHVDLIMRNDLIRQYSLCSDPTDRSQWTIAVLREPNSAGGSKYIHEDGTSMASPVVAGLAALIREYYPKLTAVQVKQIILQSVVKPTHPVVIGSGETRRVVSLSDISTTGGVVNAYQALLLAETFKR